MDVYRKGAQIILMCLLFLLNLNVVAKAVEMTNDLLEGGNVVNIDIDTTQEEARKLQSWLLKNNYDINTGNFRIRAHFKEEPAPIESQDKIEIILPDFDFPFELKDIAPYKDYILLGIVVLAILFILVRVIKKVKGDRNPYMDELYYYDPVPTYDYGSNKDGERYMDLGARIGFIQSAQVEPHSQVHIDNYDSHGATHVPSQNIGSHFGDDREQFNLIRQKTMYYK